MCVEGATDISDSGELFSPATFEFSEFLLSSLGSDGRIPYWAKCMGFSAILYGAGVMANFASNTLLPWTGTGLETSYLMDFSFIVASAVLGCTLALLLSTLRKLDAALRQVSERVGAISTPHDEEKFTEFVSWINRGMPAGERFCLKSRFWYHLETIGGAVFGTLFAIYWSFYSPNLWWGESQYVISALYFISFSAVAGYVVGAVIFVTMGAVRTVRHYCRTFISQEKVLALNPDKVGGLRPLGQFSLGLDIAFALPSLVIFSYLAQGVSITDPTVVVTLPLYTIVLVVVFFIPLSAAHDSMLKAKERARNQVNEIFKDINSKISARDKGYNFKHIRALKDVYFLHEEVSKMAVWPLNVSIILKFAATSSFPVVGSVIVAYFKNIWFP